MIANDFFKKNMLLLLLALYGIVTQAQQPSWTIDIPKPSNKSFLYIRETGFGNNYNEAYNDALKKRNIAILEYYGDEYETSLDKAGNIICKSIEGQQYVVASIKVCEWPDAWAKSDHWVFLWQFSADVRNDPQFDYFNKCRDMDLSDKHKVDRNALLLALIPGGGWGELYKNQKWGWGVVGAEVLLAGGGLACYFIGQRQQQIKNDNLNNISVYDAADRTYKTVTDLQPLLYGGAIGVHVLNLIVAYCIEDKSDKRNNNFTFVPTLMPTDKDLAWGIGINYKF